MNRYGFAFIRRSLFVKFTLSFILVGLIPLSALGSFSLNTVSSQVEKYTANNVNQMMLYLSQNVEQIFTNYNNISKFLYTNTDIYEQLNQSLSPQSNYQGYDHSVVINDYLSMILSSNKYIRNVFFVVKDTSEVYVQSRNTMRFEKNNFLWRKWSSGFDENPKSLLLVGTHTENYFEDSNSKVFTFGRQFITKTESISETPAALGVLFFDIDLRAFDELFQQINLNAHDTISIVDGSGAVMYSSSKALWGADFDGAQQSVSGSANVLLNYPIPSAGYSIKGAFVKQELYSTLVSIRNWTALLVVICLLFLIVLAVIFSKRLSHPIREVIQQMGKVESGKLDIQVPVTSVDEIGQLARGFNRMADRLSQFINVAYLAEIKQKQAELNALKSQIRPHYLYNTLEVIRMSAVSNDDRPVADMIHSLSNQLEYVLDYGENLVTIEQELEHVHHYFKLIRVRSEERVQLEIEGLHKISLSWQILKLSIQPLVENAVQHGIWPKGGMGRIRVEFDVSIEGNYLIVRVFDDGVGMSEEKVQELESNLCSQSAEHLRKHLGLQNVQDRLKTLFGASSGLFIESHLNLGTSVQFMLPITNEEERRDVHDGPKKI